MAHPYSTTNQKEFITIMFNVAVMSTNNPALILGAFALNGLYRVVSALVALIAWLVPAVLGFVAWAVVGVVGFVASHWRVLASVAGLVAAVGLLGLFWQVIVIGAGVLGGMYAGLLAVMRI